MKVAQSPKKKNARKTNLPGIFKMVRLAGIEPTTPWFVAKYSIQLSYSREALDYSLFLAAPRKHDKRCKDRIAEGVVVGRAGLEPATNGL